MLGESDMVVTYNYQLQYELCSLLFLLAITFQFVSAKKFPTRTNFIFTLILLCAVGSLTTDILGCLTVMHVIMVPLWLNYLINGLFYFLQIIIPGLTCMYVLIATGCTYKKNPRICLVMVPAVAFMLLQILNPFTRMFFYFDIIDGLAVFRTGPFHALYYIGAFFYEIVLLSIIMFMHRNLTRKQVWTIVLFSIIVAVAMVVQMKNPQLILVGTAMTIAILLWDLTLQNPDSMFDGESGVFNIVALKLYMDDRIETSKCFFTVMEIDGLSSTEREIGDKSSNILMNGIGSFLSSLSSGSVWCFRDSKTRFWVGTKSKAEMEEVSARIVERFRKSWDAGGVNIDLMAKVLAVDMGTSVSMTTPELIALIGELLEQETTYTEQLKTVTIDFQQIARHRRHQLLEESMRRSIKSGDGFYICMQPIIHVDDRSFSSAEVLLRYDDPNLGAVSPGEFIEVIEQGGMAVFIDTFVVDIACRVLAKHPEIDMFHLNISGAEFFHNPTKRIYDIVKKYGIEPKRICFEITASVAAKNPDLLMAFMNEMIQMGFSFALDDYGTGYSNILQVMKLPFATVKIDKTLLDEADKGKRILESTIKLFCELGLEIVVEGIESKTVLDRVTAMGAKQIQGYFFSPPLMEDDYVSFVKNGNRRK